MKSLINPIHWFRPAWFVAAALLLVGSTACGGPTPTPITPAHRRLYRRFAFQRRRQTLRRPHFCRHQYLREHRDQFGDDSYFVSGAV